MIITLLLIEPIFSFRLNIRTKREKYKYWLRKQIFSSKERGGRSLRHKTCFRQALAGFSLNQSEVFLMTIMKNVFFFGETRRVYLKIIKAFGSVNKPKYFSFYCELFKFLIFTSFLKYTELHQGWPTFLVSGPNNPGKTSKGILSWWT
jgi:hypothetical protein